MKILQEGEISADLFTFHEAVSQLQLLEEEVVDTHTSLAELAPQWTELDHALLAMTNDVDYDQDGKINTSTWKKQLHGSGECVRYKTVQTICEIVCTSCYCQNDSRPLALKNIPDGWSNYCILSFVEQAEMCQFQNLYPSEQTFTLGSLFFNKQNSSHRKHPPNRNHTTGTKYLSHN